MVVQLIYKLLETHEVAYGSHPTTKQVASALLTFTSYILFPFFFSLTELYPDNIFWFHNESFTRDHIEHRYLRPWDFHG